MREPEYTSLETLLAVPIPEQTETYTPVSHGFLIDEVTSRLTAGGFSIDARRFNAASDGQVMFGTFTVHKQDAETSGEYGMNIALRNSYNKTASIGMATGAVVYLCSNLSFSDYKVIRKHTPNVFVDLDNLMGDMITGLEFEFQRTVAEFQQMRQHRVDNRIIAHLIGQLFYEERLLTTTQLSMLSQCIHSEYNGFGKENLFDFYMHCSQALKHTHPIHLIKNHVGVRKVLKDHMVQIN